MRTSHLPKVSVILPAYNSEAYLKLAIDSVLAQREHVLELVIVDDGSTDRTGDIAFSYGAPVRYLMQDNKGPAAARNRGICEAKSEFISFIDADDLWDCERLEKQLDHLVTAPGADIILGKTCCFRGDPGETTAVQSSADVSEPFFCYLFGAALVRATSFQKVGLLDEQLRHGEDLDWFLRAREARLNFALLGAVSLYYRRHAESLSRNTDVSNQITAQVLKQSLDRRRACNSGSAPRLASYSQGGLSQ